MAKLEKISPGKFSITGTLDFSTVTSLLTQFHSLSGYKNDMSIDLSGLQRTNSAGLALLLELLADAKKNGSKISFSGVPGQLLDLARMSNVEHLLTE